MSALLAIAEICGVQIDVGSSFFLRWREIRQRNLPGELFSSSYI